MLRKKLLCLLIFPLLSSCVSNFTANLYESGVSHEAYLLPAEQKQTVYELNGFHYVKGVKSKYKKDYDVFGLAPAGFNFSNYPHRFIKKSSKNEDELTYFRIDIGDQKNQLKRKGFISKLSILEEIGGNDFNVKKAKPVGMLKIEKTVPDDGYYVYIQANTTHSSWGYVSYSLLPIATAGDITLSVMYVSGSIISSGVLAIGVRAILGPPVGQSSYSQDDDSYEPYFSEPVFYNHKHHEDRKAPNRGKHHDGHGKDHKHHKGHGKGKDHHHHHGGNKHNHHGKHGHHDGGGRGHGASSSTHSKPSHSSPPSKPSSSDRPSFPFRPSSSEKPSPLSKPVSLRDKKPKSR